MVSCILIDCLRIALEACESICLVLLDGMALVFDKWGEKSAKKWKFSLSHDGHPFSDYNLACT